MAKAAFSIMTKWEKRKVYINVGGNASMDTNLIKTYCIAITTRNGQSCVWL